MSVKGLILAVSLVHEVIFDIGIGDSTKILITGT